MYKYHTPTKNQITETKATSCHMLSNAWFTSGAVGTMFQPTKSDDDAVSNIL